MGRRSIRPCGKTGWQLFKLQRRLDPVRSPQAGHRAATAFAQDKPRTNGPSQHGQRCRLGGWWKRPVECGEILFREVERACRVVLPNMCNVDRLRNGHNTVLSE